MARWDDVPFQDVDNTLDIGVVALECRESDWVEISVEGGPWTPVRTMTKNPTSGIWEYWARLDAADFKPEMEGPVELRATAYPTVGKPRVLADGASMQDDVGDGSLRVVIDKGKLPHANQWVAANGSDTT